MPAGMAGLSTFICAGDIKAHISNNPLLTTFRNFLQLISDRKSPIIDRLDRKLFLLQKYTDSSKHGCVINIRLSCLKTI